MFTWSVHRSYQNVIKSMYTAANTVLYIALEGFSQLPVNHNSPGALLAIPRQGISLERRICSKQDAVASSRSHHENSRTPKDLWPFFPVEVALGALWHRERTLVLLSPLSFLPPWPASPVITQGRRRRKPSPALITGLPDYNYRLSLPNYPSDSHRRYWNSLVRWNQLLGKIGRLIFPRMR